MSMRLSYAREDNTHRVLQWKKNILTHYLFIKLDWRMLCPAVNHLYYSIISKKDSA